MSDVDLDRWIAFARLVLDETTVSSQFELSFKELRSSFINQNESYLFVTASKAGESVQISGDKLSIVPSSDALHVHFANYNVNARVDELVSLISVHAITSKTSRNKYFDELDSTLDDCAGSLDAYADLIGDPSQNMNDLAIALGFRDAAIDAPEGGEASSPAAAKKVSKTLQGKEEQPGPKIGTELPTVRLARIRGVARRPATQLLVLSRAAARLAASTSSKELEEEAASYRSALSTVAAGRDRLKGLAQVLRDESVRAQIRDYTGPIFDHYEARARKPLGRVRPWLLVALAGSAGAVVATRAAAHFWPYLGQPSWIVGFLSVAVATYLGAQVAPGEMSRTLVREQADKFRSTLERTLGLGRVDKRKSRSDTLALLDDDVPIGKPTHEPKKSLGDRLREAWGSLRRFATGSAPANRSDSNHAGPEMARGSLPAAGEGAAPAALVSSPIDVTNQANEEGSTNPLRTGGDGRAPARQYSFPRTKRGASEVAADLFSTVLSVVVAAVLGAAVSSAPMAGLLVSERLLPRPQAQLIGMTEGREACELALGRILWQDAGEFMVAASVPAPATAGEVVSVPAGRVSTIVYGDARSSIEPCKTQDHFYGKAEINVLPAETRILPIETSAAIGGGTNVTVATVPIEVALPPTSGAPARTILQFFSSIFVGGAPMPVRVPDPAQFSYVILPVFTEDVKQEDAAGLDPNSPAYAELISHFAACRSDLPIEGILALRCQPSGQTKLEAAIEPISEALATQRKQGCNIAIDVVGFASQKHFDGAKPENDDKLNWHLAEGRRLAVLVALGFDPVAGAFKPEEDVKGKLELVSRPAGETASFAGLKLLERFTGHKDMMDTLKGWLKQPEDIDQKKLDGFAEALRRSVIIAISNQDLRDCRSWEQAEPAATKVNLPG